MWQPLIEVLFLVIYAGLLTAVVPYLSKHADDFGVLIPGALSLLIGSLVWSILTWLGLSDTDGWIWALTMVLMPVGLGFALPQYAKRRKSGQLDFVDALAGKVAASAE